MCLHPGRQSYAYYCARQYSQAVERYQKVIEMDPNFNTAHLFLGWAYEQEGKLPEAIAELQKARQLEDSPVTQAALGHAYAVSGKRTEAQKLVEELTKFSKRRYGAPFWVAIVYVGLGEKDRALESLRRAYEERNTNLPTIKVDPVWDSVRSDPRFADLLRRMGLVP